MSSPAGTGSFEGWDEAVFHFGRAVGAGSVTVSSSSVLEAVSGESMSVSSETVSVSAGRTLDVSGGESVSVVSEAVVSALLAAHQDGVKQTDRVRCAVKITEK